MVPYDIIPSMGFDIIKRYKIKSIKHESIIYFEEIKIPGKKHNNITILVVTDLRIIEAMKHSTIDYKIYKWFKVKKIQYNEKHRQLVLHTHVPVNQSGCLSKP
jgi:hypothetical protein